MSVCVCVVCVCVCVSVATLAQLKRLSQPAGTKPNVLMAEAPTIAQFKLEYDAVMVEAPTIAQFKLDDDAVMVMHRFVYKPLVAPWLEVDLIDGPKGQLVVVNGGEAHGSWQMTDCSLTMTWNWRADVRKLKSQQFRRVPATVSFESIIAADLSWSAFLIPRLG